MLSATETFEQMLAMRRRPLIMGIVNVTPDSFSDGGAYRDAERAIAHALAIADAGADIVDIGGESTRPPGSAYGVGSAAVDADEEIARVVPVIAGVHAARPELSISIDTVKPEVARRAIDAGASIINDVSAGRFDESIWTVAAERSVPYILMHGHDPARRAAPESHRYDDVVADVAAFLSERITAARAAGVATIVADVGIGFAKGFDENLRLLREHRRFLSLGVPLLVGASRKAFIGRLTGVETPADRVAGTLAAHAVAVLNGASIVRVHDVAEAQQFFTVFNALVPELPA